MDYWFPDAILLVDRKLIYNLTLLGKGNYICHELLQLETLEKSWGWKLPIIKLAEEWGWSSSAARLIFLNWLTEGCWKLGMKACDFLVCFCGKKFKRVGLKQCNWDPFVAHNVFSDVKNQPKEGGLRFLRVFMHLQGLRNHLCP